MLDAGMHYGHHTSRWNPKMQPYIFGKRNLIHIINLRETLKGLITACKFITHTVASDKLVVFVGTKRQAKKCVRDEAIRCGMPFVVERWLGGTLTNFRTIRSRLERLVELEDILEGQEVSGYSKKEESRMMRELHKIRRNLDGIRNMDKIPGAVVVIDPRREKIAIAEAQRLNIPTICFADTDCDPDMADVLVPGNDDAMRSVSVVMRVFADAVITGKDKLMERQQAEAEAAAKKAAEEAKKKAAAEAEAARKKAEQKAEAAKKKAEAEAVKKAAEAAIAAKEKESAKKSAAKPAAAKKTTEDSAAQAEPAKSSSAEAPAPEAEAKKSEETP